MWRVTVGMPRPQSPRRVEALLPAHVAVDEGDEVWLELASQDLLAAALVVYGLPLASMLMVAGGVIFFSLLTISPIALKVSTI